MVGEECHAHPRSLVRDAAPGTGGCDLHATYERGQDRGRHGAYPLGVGRAAARDRRGGTPSSSRCCVRPTTRSIERWKGRVAELHRVGDVLAPRRPVQSMYEGEELGRALLTHRRRGATLPPRYSVCPLAEPRLQRGAERSPGTSRRACPLVVAGDQGPRRLAAGAGAGDHVVGGVLVSLPLGAVTPVFLGQLPALVRIVLARKGSVAPARPCRCGARTSSAACRGR